MSQRNWKIHQRQQQAPVVTEEKYIREFKAFWAYVKEITTQKDDGRQKFPEFKLMPAIKAGLDDSKKAFVESGAAKALRILDGVRAHFQSMQGSYARDLIRDLDEIYRWMEANNYHPGLLDRVRLKINAYRALVSNSRFDLDEASKLYWAAIDATISADNEHDDRIIQQAEREKKVQDQMTEDQRCRQAQKEAQRLQEKQAHEEQARQDRAALVSKLDVLIV